MTFEERKVNAITRAERNGSVWVSATNEERSEFINNPSIFCRLYVKPGMLSAQDWILIQPWTATDSKMFIKQEKLANFDMKYAMGIVEYLNIRDVATLLKEGHAIKLGKETNILIVGVNTHVPKVENPEETDILKIKTFDTEVDYSVIEDDKTTICVVNGTCYIIKEVEDIIDCPEKYEEESRKLVSFLNAKFDAKGWISDQHLKPYYNAVPGQFMDEETYHPLSNQTYQYTMMISQFSDWEKTIVPAYNSHHSPIDMEEICQVLNAERGINGPYWKLPKQHFKTKNGRPCPCKTTGQNRCVDAWRILWALIGYALITHSIAFKNNVNSRKYTVNDVFYSWERLCRMRFEEFDEWKKSTKRTDRKNGLFIEEVKDIIGCWIESSMEEFVERHKPEERSMRYLVGNYKEQMARELINELVSEEPKTIREIEDICNERGFSIKTMYRVMDEEGVKIAIKRKEKEIKAEFQKIIDSAKENNWIYEYNDISKQEIDFIKRYNKVHSPKIKRRKMEKTVNAVVEDEGVC